MICECLFSSTVPANEKVAHFITNDPEGGCQEHKISPYSPSHVEHDELLARSIDFPLREEPSGGINDSLFQDAFTFGASVQRIPKDWKQSEHIIHTRYEDRASKRRLGEVGREPSNDWRYIGSVHVTAGELRKVQMEVVRKGRVRVYDAAHTPDDPLHADVMVDASGLDKSFRKLLRVMLMNEACRRGLYVSPHISPSDTNLLRDQITLHMP